MKNCIFCKIVEKKLPANIIFEDDYFLAFHDIKPAAPVHLLLIPKKHIESINHTDKNDEIWLGKMLLLIPKIAFDNGCKPGIDGGFRIINNCGAAVGQEVLHLHFHILGGFVGS
ncbi:histidine triad nucleotide-binding protein [Candidatus Kinetoplastidibacterium crithidiae]|uniref:Hit-like cell-cycle regulation protein n=1 Tax=Candidatus Kinetoplastidibacterium crithidiae TCC036E TaxID=1208918 RepID=M1LVP1_9PROT|nr:histidine triad nucleotide-binding protein [Candidatus Kinetoplastibacterium crithidii]AFZ83042.1 Hit-like protein involved in cell-cycle regulation [Candidatus Kinetoplastibacterium crithidii (ex Angomonas deanei ATCC 30255)]AGF47319.1 hit-like cell-cycle regulation protein [Candidatus Kinetoplastibacterium crithidii TCC036E]EPY28764.1 Hit-like protein involved in cell-cycle regulation [Angomonas deanei]|eukprot:EPY28764.1 Hit-like protein involved in cell-cycle regulation [Angomonas deanei]